MMVLVDTSIWSLAFRRARHHLSSGQRQQLLMLEEIVGEGRAKILGPVRQELLSGIRSREQFSRLRKQLRAFPDVPLETEDYEGAAEIGDICRSHGLAGGPIEFLLSSVALRRGWTIYTADRDFERYARYVPFALLESE